MMLPPYCPAENAIWSQSPPRSQTVAFGDDETLSDGVLETLGLVVTLDEASLEGLNEGEGDGVVEKEGEGCATNRLTQSFTPVDVKSCRQKRWE
jgi:hypothetical protein